MALFFDFFFFFRSYFFFVVVIVLSFSPFLFSQILLPFFPIHYFFFFSFFFSFVSHFANFHFIYFYFFTFFSTGKRSLEGIDYLPKGKIQSIQNLSICLNFMSSIGIRLLGINAGTMIFFFFLIPFLFFFLVLFLIFILTFFDCSLISFLFFPPSLSFSDISLFFSRYHL